MSCPEVLILDELGGALGAIKREELLHIGIEHRCTVLMITHDIGFPKIPRAKVY